MKSSFLQPTNEFYAPLQESILLQFKPDLLDHSLQIAINDRVRYIFSKLKNITQSTITDFNYVNAYDNDDQLGFFDIQEFSNEVVLMGNFTDKYSKPFGHSFPTSFLFKDFEKDAQNIYTHFLIEKTAIFDTTTRFPKEIIAKEYSYDRMIADIS